MEITDILSRIDAKTVEIEAEINAQYAADESEIKQKISELEGEREKINLDSESEKTRIRDAYSTIIGTKLKIKEGTKAVKRENEARDRLLKGIDKNAHAKRAEIDAQIEVYNTQLTQRTRENETQLQDARQKAEQDKQNLSGAYLDVEAANQEIKNIDEEIQKIQRTIESLEKNKQACQEEIKKVQGHYVQGENGQLNITREQLEYENDLQKIENELSSKQGEITVLKDRKSVEEVALAAANKIIQSMSEKYAVPEKSNDEEQKTEPVVVPEPTIEPEVPPTPEPEVAPTPEIEDIIPTPMPEPVPEATSEQEVEPEPVVEPKTQQTHKESENVVLKAAQYVLARELFEEVTEQEKLEIANGNFKVFDDIWKRIDEEPIAGVEEYWKEMAKEELGIDDKNSITRRIFSILSKTEKEEIANNKVSLVDVIKQNHPNELNEYLLLRPLEMVKLKDKISVMCKKECSKDKQEIIEEPKEPEEEQNKEKEQVNKNEIIARIFAVLTEEEKKDIAAFWKRSKGTYALSAIMYYKHSDLFKEICDTYSDEIIDLVEWSAAMNCEFAYPTQKYTDEELKQLMKKTMNCREQGSIMEQEDWKIKWMDEWLTTEQKTAPTVQKQVIVTPKQAQAPATPKKNPPVQKQVSATPKQSPAEPKQTPTIPKQAPAAPKQQPTTPTPAPAAPTPTPKPKQIPTPKKIDYEKIFIGIDKNGTIMDIEAKTSEQSVEGEYTPLLARRKVISVENIDAAILANAESKGDKFVIEEILTNKELGSKQKEEILKAYTEMIELRQADPKADIFMQKSIFDLHYDLRRIDEAYLSDAEREELILKAREADKLKIAKVKAGPQLRAKWMWEDIKAIGRNLKNRFWNKNNSISDGGTPLTEESNSSEIETLPPPISPKTTVQETTKNGHQIFAEGLGNTTYDRNDEVLPGTFGDIWGTSFDEEELINSNMDQVEKCQFTTPKQGEEVEEEDYEIV